jgi:hypothetical protein
MGQAAGAYFQNKRRAIPAHPRSRPRKNYENEDDDESIAIATGVAKFFT